MMHDDGFMRSIVEALTEPLVVLRSVRDDDGVLVDFVYDYVNDPALAVIGAPRETVVGHGLLELFPFHRESGLFDGYRNVVETGEPVKVEAPWVHRQRGPAAYEITATRFGDGVLSIIRNVTERVAEANRLSSSERRYRFLADHAGDVAVMTNGGVMQWVSPSVFNVLGWRPEDLVGQTVAWLVHPDDMARGLYEDEAEAFVPVRARVQVKNRDGTWRWVDVTGRRATEEDSDLDGTWVFVFWDVDNEVKALAALQEAEDRVRHAQRLDSLGVLAGGIAHDFNNLLVGILGNADLLLHSPDTSIGDQQALQNISEAAEQAAQLTRQLLDYAGQRSVEIQPVDLADVLAQVQQLASTTMTTTTPITLDLPADLPKVLADPGRLQQLMMNLILNAFQAAQVTAGTVSVSATTRQLSHSDEANNRPYRDVLVTGPYVVIAVTDTGPGMTAEVRERLFEPFFTTRPDGRGLGLSVVHGIVTSLGGAIEIESALGVGTSVRVLLQAAPADDPAPAHPAAAAPAPASADSASLCVLVVDDQEFVLKFVERALTAAGHQVITALDGGSALDMLARHAEGGLALPQLAIVDVTMPGMQLPQLIRGLRATRPDIAVIVMSGFGYHDLDDPPDGIAGFLQKPFKIETLHAAVNEVPTR